MSPSKVSRLIGNLSDWTMFIWILITVTLLLLSEEGTQVLGNNVLNHWLKYSLVVKTVIELVHFFITRIGRNGQNASDAQKA